MPGEERLDRIWLPLLLIGKEKKFVGKTRLQKLTYLVQVEVGLPIYDFKKHYYGPFSRELENDILAGQDLINAAVRPKIFEPNEIYYEFKLTEKGRKMADEFEKRLDEKLNNAIAKYSKLPTHELLERAYSTLKNVDERLGEVEREALSMKNSLCEIFEANCNRQALFLMTVTDYALTAIQIAKKADEVQKVVILRLAAELIERCQEAFSEVVPPVDSEKLRPIFMTIADLWGTLIEYCEKINLVRNPFELGLEEVISEDEAKRLQEALRSIEVRA
ncbi:MAG: hypothetical protein ABC611_08155 [Candidatus Methanosuratincola petrocarbonis]